MPAALPLAFWVFDRVLDWIGGSPVTYALCAGIAALDAFLPIVPSETFVVTAAALAASGDLTVYLIFVGAALGSFVGDNISYLLGARLGDPIADRYFSGEGPRRRQAWARRMLDRHGAAIIVAARFVPGGRTATTFSAGTLAYPWRRFVVYDAVAAVNWGAYCTLLGYLGGRAFAESPWKSIGLAVGAAALVALLAEVYRRVQASRGRDLFGEQEETV